MESRIKIRNNLNLELSELILNIARNLEKRGMKDISIFKYNCEEIIADLRVEEFKDDILNDKFINYYWLTFKNEETKYKISLFYKEIDCSSGNLHILPGAIQFWDNVEIEEKKLKNILNIKKKSHFCMPFTEVNWYPLLDEIIYPYCNDSNEIVEYFWQIINNNKAKYKGKNCDRRNFFNYIINGYKFQSITSLKYPFIRYIRKEETKIYWLAIFQIIKLKEEYFTKYGQIVFYQDILDTHLPQGPNEYKNGRWELYYGTNKEKNKNNNIFEISDKKFAEIYEQFKEFTK